MAIHKRSDLRVHDGDEQSPKVAATQILKHEVREGIEALERSTVSLFVSALSGGLDVGFSVFLMGVIYTEDHGRISDSVLHLLIANMYSVGFIFVVLGRSELFTEQTALAVLPVLRGRASIRALARLWAIVYVANLIGATLFARLISYVGPKLHAVSPEAFGAFGHRLVDHADSVIFLSAVLAGWLMGLLSWMVAAGRDTISQIVIVWLVTTAIGLGGLHHVVLGTVEVMAAVFSNQGIAPTDIARFLLWTTLGNAFGGSFFVSLIKYGHARPE